VKVARKQLNLSLDGHSSAHCKIRSGGFYLSLLFLSLLWPPLLVATAAAALKERWLTHPLRVWWLLSTEVCGLRKRKGWLDEWKGWLVERKSRSAPIDARALRASTRKAQERAREREREWRPRHRITSPEDVISCVVSILLRRVMQT